MVTAAFLLCAGGGASHQPPDLSELQGLDVPEGLQQFLGALVTKVQGLEEKNAKLQKEQNRAQVVEAELRDEISWLKKDREAFQNKTRVVEADNAALRIEVTKLRGALNSHQTKKDLQRINARLDQCEADTFTQMVERRRVQDSGDTVIGDAQPVQIFKRAVTFSHLHIWPRRRV
eukprot:SAG22_NODE_1354_length_4636_cov_70.001763_3_plen_175_part_00